MFNEIDRSKKKKYREQSGLNEEISRLPSGER